MAIRPKISVIMPNYNGEKYIWEAIESILQQTFTDFELIIIDDGSTDHSWDIIQKYAERDTRIVVLKNKTNKHIVYTRNIGITNAKWVYIAFLDSDDIAFPERLEKQIKIMENNKKIGICGSNSEIIKGNGDKIGEKRFPQTNEECKNAIWYKNPFSQSTVVIRKKCFDEIGMYDDNFRNTEDLDMWIRIGTKYELYNIQETLVKYRIHGENSIIKQQQKMIKNTLKCRRKAIKLGYKIWWKGIIFYIWTWCMLFLPPKYVVWLFNVLNR